ncbi:MAG: helix-turn-helix domain-containing protein [Clostridiales bacterium]|nr:helix-turn-helix domain-containing protein [Clostridiales bacterium]
MNAKYIYLTVEQQEYLRDIVRKGEHNSHEVTRARVLLMLDRTGKSDHVRYKRVAEALEISVQAVYNMRDDYLEKQDILAYLTRKKRETPPVPPKVTGELEAKVIALACSEPPEGYARWTLRLLSSRVVELGYIDSISYGTVRNILKKRNISLI